MTEKTTCFMLTVPTEIAQRAENLKRDMFYDKPYTEMYRQLIQIGIENSQKNNKQCERAS